MTDSTNASIWPLDVSKLVKGQTITLEECRTIIGKEPDTKDYAFGLMRLREFIMEESEQAGRPLSVSTKSNTLVIHTDSQAAAYHVKQMQKNAKAIRKNLHHLKTTVDPTKLTEAERRKLDNDIKVWSMRAARMSNKRLIE